MKIIFVRSDGNQWLFLSGLVLGLAGNILISALAPTPRPSNWGRLVLSGGCFVIASGCFSFQGWMLQRFEYMARFQDQPSHRVHLNVKKRLVDASLGRLLAVTLLGLCFTLAGVVCIALPLSPSADDYRSPQC